MQEYLVSEAALNVWCNPYQDTQYVVEPARITFNAGALNSIRMLEREITLPIANKRTHVFQIGQYPPALLGMLENWPNWAIERWFTFEKAMNELPLYANIYNDPGVNIPRSNAYFMMTKEKCLIIAVIADKRIKVDYARDKFYLRVYTSAWLKSSFRPQSSLDISVRTSQPQDNREIARLRDEYLKLKELPGNTETFINGVLVKEVNPITVKLDDVVEFIYESSVKRTVEWKVKTLKSYTSTLDTKKKYILHYSKNVKVDEIDFYDDIDVYIFVTDKDGTQKGHYYHKNKEDAMRMLTHRDYGITGDYVSYVIENLFKNLEIEGGDFLDATISLKIRRNDYRRKLIWDPNKTFELYKLSDARILMAMSGVDSLVPPWWASNLEASEYCLYMGRLYEGLTPEATEDALGYNYTSQVLADSPLKVVRDSGALHVPLPYGVAVYPSTAYEYTDNGKLIGVHHHTSKDNDYNVRSSRAHLVEVLMGLGTNRPDVKTGDTDIPIDGVSDFRVYMCWYDFSVTPPKPSEKWIDITGDDTLYTIVDNKVTWTSVETGQYLMVRTNASFLSYSFKAKTMNGNLIFQLSETTPISGVLAERPCSVPGEDLQIWIEGNNLVQGIDYIVNFPYVCINNYSFFKQPFNQVEQEIHVRMTGFCGKDLKLGKPKATGFVVNGCISQDKKYDIWRDKVMHLSIAGSTMHKDSVTFFEDAKVWEPRHPLNGTPYQIVNTTVPLRDFTVSGTYPLQDKARDIDEKVEGYMDMYYPFKPEDVISVAQARWRLVSPFVSQMVHLCLDKEIDPDPWVEYTDMEVIQMCKPYEVLLPFDPMEPGNELPEKYVNITPHRFSVTQVVTRAQMRFLESVVRLYGQDKVGLNNFITFTV